MVKKLKVAVLMGGKSPEHQISLLTGREIAKNLSPKKYDPLSIIISRNGKSFRLNNKEYLLGQLSTVNCQLFIIAMHGPYGEDGTIQGFLDLIGVPYTGSGVLASALGMDKIYSRKLFTHKGLKVPKYLVLSKDEKQSKVWQHLLPPIFIKPNAQGSSIGASIVKKKKNLKKALNLAFSYGNTTIIEEFLDGIEVTCAILGNSNPKPLPLVEIIPKKEFFDYEAKYNENYEGPQSYKGYSGGGLWQLIIDKSKDGVFQIKERILSGVIFYQSPITGIIRSIKCHGRHSIYNVAIDHIKGIMS